MLTLSDTFPHKWLCAVRGGTFDLDDCADCPCYGDCLDEAAPVIPLPDARTDAPIKIVTRYHGRERYRHRMQHERGHYACA